MPRIIIPIGLAALCGFLALTLVEPYGPDREHWDNPIFWKYAYSGICVACAALGFFYPKHAWTYGVAAMGVQGLPALLANLDAELIAVSLAVLAAISVPPALAGVVGAWATRRRNPAYS